MNINEAFPSKYLKSQDIGNHRPTVVISEVAIEEVGIENDKSEKPVVYFEGKDKGLVLNKTNANTIAGMYGSDTDAWKGQSVTLCTAEVPYKGKMTLSIRVSSIKPLKGASGKPADATKTQNQTEPAVGEDDEIPF